ncbi:MAG: AAA family ATPase [Desulfobacteraceae bacterium]|nr:AAA family ATPase [Desulfobacteraceae bacterium]
MPFYDTVPHLKKDAVLLALTIEFDKSDKRIDFTYEIIYDLEGKEHTYKWDGTDLSYNDRKRKTVSKNTLPDNILVYYSGHNDTVSTIIDEYQEHFSKRIKKADIDESRKFLGIGSGYKSILLGVLLLQPESSKARTYVCDKLGILQQSINISLTLKRPVFASKNLVIDRFEESTFYWETKGITLDFLKKIVSCIKDSFNHADLYDFDRDLYHIKIDGDLYREVFKNTPVTEQFRFFDNLNSLEMLLEMSAEFVLADSAKATINQFSDGQFQSVYIYSILEFFKDRKCLLLLDEPDCFLHPEWQHGFLKQVLDIAEEKQQMNHILMSSHSASTIAPVDTAMLSLVVIEDSRVKQEQVSKAEVIRSLSGGLITFTEEVARLNIKYNIDHTDKPILFTEGITDEIIIETAWKKLFPDVERPFEVQNAFSCGFLRNLVKDKNLYENYPDKIFFALFDFDEAYNDWKQLGTEIQSDPENCLVNKKKGVELYSMLLPVPLNAVIKKQVINPKTGKNYGEKSLLTIEHLFYGQEGVGDYFIVDINRTDEFIKFKADSAKVKFAKEIVPNLCKSAFCNFLPIFDFIQSKIK